MASMSLKRAVDGYVLSNRIEKWTGWGPYGENRQKDTITGKPISFNGQRGLVWATTVTCTFAPDSPGSTTLNYRELVRLQRRNQMLSFTDLDGVVTAVQALSLGETRQWEDVKHKTIFDVEMVLIDPRIAY